MSMFTHSIRGYYPFLVIFVFALCACGKNPTPEQLIFGLWRNDTIKSDYHFNANNNLEIIGKDGTSTCTTLNIDSWKPETRTMEVTFKCPEPDWPGHEEAGEFVFAPDFKSFVDTHYIQGIGYRVDGTFIRISP